MKGMFGFIFILFLYSLGWSAGATVLGKLPVPGRPTIWMIVGQGPISLAVGAGGGCLDIFTLLFLFSSLSPSLWEKARCRLKYCLKGPLNQKQPTNQPIFSPFPSVFLYSGHSLVCTKVFNPFRLVRLRNKPS